MEPTSRAVEFFADGLRLDGDLHLPAAAAAPPPLPRTTASAPSRLIAPFELLPLPPVTRAYVESELMTLPEYGSQVSLEAAEWLLRFRPEELVACIAPRPLLLIHGAGNDLYAAGETERLHAAAGEPREQVLLPGLGHTEWMRDDDPAFVEVAGRLSAFFADALGPPLPG